MALAGTVVDRVTAAAGRAVAVAREALAVLVTAPGLVQVPGPASALVRARVDQLVEEMVAAAPPIPAARPSVPQVYAGDIETLERLEALPAFWRGRALARRIEAELIGAGHAADVHLNKAKEYDAIADRLAKWRS